MFNIILSSHNSNKYKEISHILTPLNIKLLKPPDGFNFEETGKTFLENAIIKAKSLYEKTGEISLGDDSGLCVNVLNGYPGVYSARYEKTAQKRIEKLLNEIKNVPYSQRDAHFTCAIVLYGKNKILFSTEKYCYGKISFEPIGNNGFGYDPIFFFPNLQKTMAQLTSEEKNRISHRGQAIEELVKFLKNFNL